MSWKSPTSKIPKSLRRLSSGERKRWNLLSTVVAIAAGVAARTALTAGWKHLRGEAPPEDPVASSTGWTSALGWGIGTGVAVGVARVLGRRGAAAGWEHATGSAPPA